MQINKKSHRKRYIIIGIFVGLILFSGFAYALVISESRKSNDSLPAKDEAEAGANKKLESLDSNDQSSKEQTDTATDISAKELSDTDSSKSSPTIRITAKSQNGSLYQIRSMIDTVESNGNCTLTLSKNGTVVTKVSQTQPLAQATTCKGFDIPLTELNSGIWALNISYKSSDTTLEINDSIEIK